jgi:hypothetical protein
VTVNVHVLRRLSWRVPIIVAVYLTPTFVGISEEAAKPLREACVGALVVVFGSWVSKQGKRQKPDQRPSGGGNG